MIDSNDRPAYWLEQLVHRPQRRLDICVQVFASAIAAYRAPYEAYDPDLAQVWPDSYSRPVLERLSSLLPRISEAEFNYQAPVSFRVVPRVLMSANRLVSRASTLATSIGAPTRPVPPSMVTPVLDQYVALWADLALLADKMHAALPREGGNPSPLLHESALAVDQARGRARRTPMVLHYRPESILPDIPDAKAQAAHAAEAAGRDAGRAFACLAIGALAAANTDDRENPLQPLHDRVRALLKRFNHVEAARELADDFESEISQPEEA
ncbi:hypothetical protein [Planotetraspora sp. GP83]|uniref:hypothetical protein n=1 Tax=Planotetraspora sp. GP83 TaxID=3156264 RepID=UPI003516ADE9